MSANPPDANAENRPPVSRFSDSRESLRQNQAIHPPQRPGLLGRLDHYEILSQIGQGGMGEVFKARDTVAGRVVAIKVLRPELATHGQARHRFDKEARHMSQLKHPHILEVLAVGAENGVPYFAMPLMEHGSLARILQPTALLGAEQCLSIAQAVAGALCYAHTKGITHRDLKPGNVLLDGNDVPHLSDFGLARTLFNDSLTDVQSAQQEGTTVYMSPQLARGEAEDTRCDIYAFGALLYELLTGHAPYEGASNTIILEKIRRGPPPPILGLRPGAPADLVRIAETAMAREHRDRYASMADVVADLERVKRGDCPVGCRALDSARTRKFRRVTMGAATICGLALVVFVASSRWLPPSRPPQADPSELLTPAPKPSYLELVRTIETSNSPAIRNAHLADWDGDGQPDLVFADGEGLSAISYDGHRLPSLPLNNPHTTPPRLDLMQDFDGDGRDDAFVSWANGTNLHIAVWNHSGQRLQGFSFRGSVHTHAKWGVTYSRLWARQIVDLDGDGRRELLAEVNTTWGKRPRGLACFDLATGTNQWFYETAPFLGPLLLRDLNQDGKLEVVFGSLSAGNSNSLADGTDDLHAYLYAVSQQGRCVWSRELCDYFAVVEPVSASAPGAKEYLLFTSVVSSFDFRSVNDLPESGRVLTLNRSGHPVGKLYDAGLRLMSCLSADLEGDGQPEILCTDRAGYLHVLNSDLSLRRKVLLTTNQFSYVNLMVHAVAPLGPDQENYVVLASSQIETRGARIVGNDPAQVSQDVFHDNAILVLDSRLNLVAKHVVKESAANCPVIKVKVLPPLRGEKTSQVLVLAEKAEFFRLNPEAVLARLPSLGITANAVRFGP